MIAAGLHGKLVSSGFQRRVVYLVLSGRGVGNRGRHIGHVVTRVNNFDGELVGRRLLVALALGIRHLVVTLGVLRLNRECRGFACNSRRRGSPSSCRVRVVGGPWVHRRAEGGARDVSGVEEVLGINYLLLDGIRRPLEVGLGVAGFLLVLNLDVVVGSRNEGDRGAHFVAAAGPTIDD